MDLVLGKFDKSKLRYYLDDVILATNTEEEMLKLIEDVLQELIKNNLTIDPAKVQSFKTEIDFLGFKLHKNGYSPSEKNIHKITSFARPKTRKALKSFLGCAQYFSHLLYKYAHTVAPLIELTKQKRKFVWTDEAEKSFQTIQDALLKNPTLTSPDLSKEFFLITDGSQYAISGILAQERNEHLMPIEFYGRKLKESEKNYPSIKFELLAMHNSILHFKNFLLGKKFTILSDAQSLTFNLDMEKQNGIVARWLMDLVDYDYAIEYIEGKINPADYTSRNLNNLEMKELRDNLFAINSNLSMEKIKIAQEKDIQISKLLRDIKDGKDNKQLRKYRINNNGLLVLKKNKIKSNKEVIIAPEELRRIIFDEAHKAHFGFTKTYHTIRVMFFWHNMYRDIKQWCTNCVSCNINKKHATVKVPIQKPTKNYIPGQVLHVDIVGKLPLSFKKNSFIFTIIDVATRYLYAVAIPNLGMYRIISELNKYFSAFGIARQIHSDNAKYFKGNDWQNYMQKLGIDMRYGSVYRANSQAVLERSHQTLKQSISAMCNETFEWEDRLNYFLLSYNTTIHRALNHTPAYLFFARDIGTPFTQHSEIQMENLTQFVKSCAEHMREAKKMVLKAQEKIFQEYDKKNENVKEVKLDLGQIVYLKKIQKPSAFESKFLGPMEVIKCFRNNNYLLKELNTNKKFIKRHVTQLYAPKNAKWNKNGDKNMK